MPQNGHIGAGGAAPGWLCLAVRTGTAWSSLGWYGRRRRAIGMPRKRAPPLRTIQVKHSTPHKTKGGIQALQHAGAMHILFNWNDSSLPTSIVTTYAAIYRKFLFFIIYCEYFVQWATVEIRPYLKGSFNQQQPEPNWTQCSCSCTANLLQTPWSVLSCTTTTEARIH